MSLEYKPRKTNSGRLEIYCEDPDAIVKCMSIYGFCDSIYFEKRNRDGSIFGSYWGLHNLGCFKELKQYERLRDMTANDIEKLAVRVYEILYSKRTESPNYYVVPPEINNKDQRFKKILEELTALQATEKRLLQTGELVFPPFNEKTGHDLALEAVLSNQCGYRIRT